MLISVYGTLRKDEGNHRFLRNSKFLGVSETEASYTMYNNGGFPYVCLGGNTRVTIETYELSEADKHGVFGLEGYTGVRNDPRNWYDTADVKTPWGNSQMFILKIHPDLKIIESGDWKKDEI